MIGIKPHSRQERMETVEKLILLWQKKFKDNLIAVALSGSVARQEDEAYSDLELDVFLKEKPKPEEDSYFQRVVNGMLIEAIYYTPEEYVKEYSTISSHWPISASDHLVGVYNSEFVAVLMARVKAVNHSNQEFIQAATRARFEWQEAFCKVLNAIAKKNSEGISLLVMEAALQTMKILALYNQHSFTTFALYISESRAFRKKPDGFDDLLDLLVQGAYQDLERLEHIIVYLFNNMETIFDDSGIQLFQDALDPNIPNQSILPVVI